MSWSIPVAVCDFNIFIYNETKFSLSALPPTNYWNETFCNSVLTFNLLLFLHPFLSDFFSFLPFHLLSQNKPYNPLITQSSARGIVLRVSTEATHLFGSSNFICSQYYASSIKNNNSIDPPLPITMLLFCGNIRLPVHQHYSEEWGRGKLGEGIPHFIC